MSTTNHSKFKGDLPAQKVVKAGFYPVHSLNRQVFDFFEGKWSVDRRFEGSYCGSFHGAASFVPERGKAACYQYLEQGALMDGAGQRFDAKQSYRYRLAAGQLQVLKREESEWMMMHELDFRDDNGIATAEHIHRCGQDHYAAVYRIDFTGTWEVAYTVNGPKKDYRIRTVYSRGE